ncbi:MAG: ATPase, T2SS/T4P/T4SS family [Candidatus Faecimonas sp.]|nr:Flp pilus assembly complex ATPase component TadA [Mycoplasmatota bacterium]MDY2907915.1 ATPase, T2SS/T4P/T4SS family [Candidatus Faecimonas sp.]
MIKFDFNKTPITQIADYIIISSARLNASDIHFDPREDGMMVRTRVDGDLQNFTFIPKTYERNLTTRLKLLANMNITESRLPQDGAIKGNFGGTYLDMRVSCLPLNEGEKIVIRILDYTRSLQGLDSLGFNEQNLARLKRMIRVPNGIILITGETGSGKSTTVYSILETLNREETNIITVEDPIEMNIEGLNQVQVNAEIGMTFAAALRSILRQDPNVILIGEIRDSETAQIAVRSAITGHLVLSTIHTNNTLATVERLLDMNVERYLLSTALTGIISQRLAKKICTKCRIERDTTDFEKMIFKKYLHKDIDKIWDANHEGCDACRKGYKGRIAIQEVLELNDELRSDLNNENISKEELSKLVYNDKIITMLQDALGKVVDGTTSFEEVLRVIEIEDAEDFFEKDTEEKVKEHQKEKDKEIQKELEEQEKKQEQAKNIHETNLEEVSLNIKKENTTPEIKATLRTIPTNIEEVPKDSIAKTTSNNKSINTLEKIETIDKQKTTQGITTPLKTDATVPTPFTKPNITSITNTTQTVPNAIPTIVEKKETVIDQPTAINSTPTITIPTINQQKASTIPIATPQSQIIAQQPTTPLPNTNQTQLNNPVIPTLSQ